MALWNILPQKSHPHLNQRSANRPLDRIPLFRRERLWHIYSMQLAAFKAIVSSLDKEDVQFLIVGGMAVVAHGYGRVTFDIDIVIQLNSDNIIRGFRALESIGYRPRVPVTGESFSDEQQRAEWIETKGMLVLNFFSDKYPRTMLDVFVSEPFDFDVVYDKALKEELDDSTPFRVVDLETLIAMKNEAGRDKDLDDIKHLRMIQDGQ